MGKLHFYIFPEFVEIGVANSKLKVRTWDMGVTNPSIMALICHSVHFASSADDNKVIVVQY